MKLLLPALTRAKTPQASRPVLDGLHQRLGHVPRFYATLAHSAPALSGYLDFTTTLRTGTLDGAETETVYLAAAEAHQCADAVATHTAAGRLHGFTEAEILAARSATSPDPRLRALAALAYALVHTQGHPEPALLQQFFAAGYSRAALVEVVGLVAASTFHSYVVHLAAQPTLGPATVAVG